jgi:phosphatidylserine/phosphatidylglycerophosphate/cardiolipin synthase-like enzyme
VRIRLLTNDYKVTSAPGLVDPLQFLALQPNVEVRFFRTLTFWHAKYLQADATRSDAQASVSSVNFSKTSFMYNREAGLILTGPGVATVLAGLHAVFEHDFNMGIPHVINQRYSASAMAVILNTTQITLPVPPPYSRDGFVPKPAPVTGGANVTFVPSPDGARAFLLAALAGAGTSFRLYTYQVTDPALCDALIARHAAGVELTLLFSRHVFSGPDQDKSTACYTKMFAAGLKATLTDSWDFEYSHQKYWIADGKDLFLSTGNWSPSDFPVEPPTAFVPPSQPGWRESNRDFNIAVRGSADVVAQFVEVMDKDLARGWPFEPKSMN